MDLIETNCPGCGAPLELPGDFDNVVCASCGSAYTVRRHKGAINLSAVARDQAAEPDPGPNGTGKRRRVELRLNELEEEIGGLASEIEDVKSREQAAPLQAGCAFFGVFMLVISLLAFFATVGRAYFGGWAFYVSLAAVVLFGLARMRRKLITREHLSRIREERRSLEGLLAELESERADLRRLRDSLDAPGAPARDGREAGPPA